ncbi:MAG: ATP-binding protein [Nostoc sp.]|uniref:sensor histidine kinase n=1 Tax=Nostoc sp. TaxID=1180 RepID=UPI002FFCC002
MKIRHKLISGFIGISLLTAVVGGVAISQQFQISQKLAIKESQQVAETIANFLTSTHKYKSDETGNFVFYQDSEEVQSFTEKLHNLQKRDIVVVDIKKHILADAVPENIGTTFDHDRNNEVSKTIQDGVSRYFIEKSRDYPQGIKLVAIPLKLEEKQIVGAIILEYTPIYQEALAAAQSTTIAIAITSLTCIILALVLGSLISQSIANPLQVVTDIAQKATKNSDFELQIAVTTNDEIGILANSFNELIQRVKELIQEKEQRADELIKANKKLQSTQKQMIAQEKLASLGSLTAGIAHEIRNPLNFINNFAELSVDLTQELLDEIESHKQAIEPEFAEEITAIISDLQINSSKIDFHGKRAENIVSNMLMHSRGGERSWQGTNLNNLLQETLNLAYHGMRAKDVSFNVALQTEYDQTIGEISVVIQDINRAFLNIISNACYAVCQKQKEISPDFSPLVKVSTKNLGEKVEIRIFDNGSGIPPEILDKIFEHFFTTKPTGEGTGLGLSLSYEIIVQQHQGELKVESDVGSFTQFIIYLPKK